MEKLGGRAMKFSISHVLAVLTALMVAVGSHAAQSEDPRGSSDNTVAAVTSSNLEELTGEAGGESRGESASEAKGSSAARNKTGRTTQLLVKSEPGDGLVKLTWKFVNLPPKVDGHRPRFTIRYGVESEKLTKTLQVGTTDGYVLRELKNNQPYYIQVVAGDRDQLAMYKSDEIRAIPLSAEDLGSRLEKAYSKKTLTLMDKNEQDPFVRDLRQFGYDFFKNSAQLLGAMDTLPVGDDYILGPGDTLSLNLWGSINARHELTVDRNGEIMIPKVGTVKVWGLTYEQGKNAVNKAIGRYYKNYELGMTLGRLRSIQVYRGRRGRGAGQLSGQFNRFGNQCPVSCRRTGAKWLAAQHQGYPHRPGATGRRSLRYVPVR